MPVELMRKDAQVELIKKSVQLCEMPKQESMQTVKERDIIVPDGKPDLQNVIYLDGNMTIDQMDVQEDRVVYKGQIDITVLYTPTGDSKEVYRMNGSIPLEDFIIMEGVDQGQQVEMDYQIEHLHWNVMNERKLNVKAIIQATVAAMKEKETMVVTGTEGDSQAQVQTKKMMVTQPAKTGQDNIMVKDELTIMQGKESVGELLKMTATIKEEQIKRTDTDILYNGIIEMNTLYKPQDEEMGLQVVTHRIPFSGSLDVLKNDDEMYWDCELEVAPTYIQVQPDYDGEDRIIEVECMVSSKYHTYNKMEMEVVDDIYCPGKKMGMDKKDTPYMTLVGRTEMKTPKKEIMTLEGDAPEQDQIFQVKVTPAIEEKDVQNDKLTMRGMMEVKVMYITDDMMEPVKVVMDMMPFVQEVTLPGMKKGQYIDADVKVKDVNVSPYNKTDLMVEYVMDCVVDAYDDAMLSAIDEVMADDMTKEQMDAFPSITVYVVQKGDTLWEIAKRYNTTVQDIEEINELEPNGLIYPMQKLIIVKNTKF